MTAAEENLSREQRRRRTEAAILQAARELFAETGFERTTIRAVATRAGIDPALVMQHYGSKEGLFAEAARWHPDHGSILTATSDTLARAAVDDLLARFEGEGREASVALARSCLTHPSASRIMRDEVMCDRAQAVTDALQGEDRELRAALFGAVMMGVGLARYLIETEPLASAPARDLRRLLEPVLRVLVDGPVAGEPPTGVRDEAPGGPSSADPPADDPHAGDPSVGDAPA